MIRETHAKTLLSRVSKTDRVFGLDYSLNLYRGCQHRCIYCDSRSQCYGIGGFDREILVKVNAVQLLRAELSRKRKRGVIGTGSMNDPYMPLEEHVGLTRQALGVIADYGFGVHVITKSDLVVRDIDVLKKISRVSAAVSFTITTTDDRLAKMVEPGAPPPSSRLHALRTLSQAGIETRVALMPTLPFLEDTWDNVSSILEQAHRFGAQVVVPWFGMTLRDRQREHYYVCLDERFPGLRARYEETYGDAYVCPSPHAEDLTARTKVLCERLGLSTAVSPLLVPSAEAPTLFD